MAIRTLNFAESYGSDKEQQTFARELLEGFSEAGFVKLVNHGVSLEDLNQLFAWVICAPPLLKTLWQILIISRTKPSSVFHEKRKSSSPTPLAQSRSVDGALFEWRRPEP